MLLWEACEPIRNLYRPVPSRGGKRRPGRHPASAALRIQQQGGFARSGPRPDEGADSSSDSNTGELYAEELSEPDERRDPVEVLGVLWSRPQAEACLAGWSERCGGQRSLLWAREQIRRWRPLVEEGQFLQERPKPRRPPRRAAQRR